MPYFLNFHFNVEKLKKYPSLDYNLKYLYWFTLFPKCKLKILHLNFRSYNINTIYYIKNIILLNKSIEEFYLNNCSLNEKNITKVFSCLSKNDTIKKFSVCFEIPKNSTNKIIYERLKKIFAYLFY
jgi:hypothetical protein